MHIVRYYNRKGNINIDTGDGNDTIVSVGSNTTIKTGDGKQDFTVLGNNVDLVTGIGNKTINVTGNNVGITTGTGNQNVTVLGNDVDIKLDQNAAQDWDFEEVNDKDSVIVIGDKGNINIDTGDGDDIIVSVGSNNNIKTGDGDKHIVFDGDNVDIKAGKGNHNIYTLDYAIMDGVDVGVSDKYEKELDNIYDNRIASKLTTEQVGESKITRGEQVGTDTTTVYEGNKSSSVVSVTGTTAVNRIASNEAAKLKDIDFTQMDGSYPKYVLALAKDNKYHIYQHSSGNIYRAAYSSLASINSQVLKFSNAAIQQAVKNIQVTGSEHDQYTAILQDFKEDIYEDTVTNVLVGNKNVNIEVGEGANSMKLNVSENIKINCEDNNTKYKNGIYVTGGIEFEGSEVSERKGKVAISDTYTGKVVGNSASRTTTSTTTSRMNINVISNASQTYDPIVVDFNRDGKLSSMTKIGVDIDGDGTADGAAVDGDKMLTMSDISGNGVIDGKEVFGNATISPFTKKPLNAANGFEALRMIAEEAKARGCDCIDTQGNVDLKKLSEELAKVGVKLGFISDTNNTQVEDLGHVASINVGVYSEHDVTEDKNIQIGQAGTYKDTNGDEYMASDFWYKTKK